MQKKDQKIGQLSGMPGFTIVCLGQCISMLGSSMTQFAIMLWLWKTTGQATPFALFGFTSAIPRIIASPFAGALVDRWNRKFTMAISDLAAGAATICLLLLFLSGGLQVWHLYLLGAIASFFGAFQFPAFSAATTMMVAKEDYARATGMVSVTETVAGILSPILAAVFMETIGMQGIFLIDIVTVSIAVGVLLLVRVPQPTAAGQEEKGSIWKEAIYGFRYLFQRKPLIGLLIVFLVMNMVLSFSGSLRTPMILGRTGNNKWILSGVQTATTVGGLLAGLLLTVWGGPKKRIRGLFAAMTGLGIGVLLMGCGEGVLIWSLGGSVTIFAAVIANGCSQAFWQTKVAPEVQGRVFAARSLIGGIASPLTMLISGPLADRVFEPAIANGGALVKSMGWLVGSEPGSGIALMYLITGILAIGTALVGYMFREIREADILLPDHQMAEGV